MKTILLFAIFSFQLLAFSSQAQSSDFNSDFDRTIPANSGKYKKDFYTYKPAPAEDVVATKKICTAFFKDKLNAEALEKKLQACAGTSVRDATNNTTNMNQKYGVVSAAQYESCFKQWRVLENETTEFVKDCAISYESSNLISANYNTCFTVMKPLVGAAAGYTFCGQPMNMDSAKSPAFPVCLDKLKKLGGTVTQAVDKCKDSWNRDKFSTPQFDSCTARLMGMGITGSMSLNICEIETFKTNVNSQGFAACAKAFETAAKSDAYEQAGLCTNSEILTNYQARQSCYVTSLKATYRNYAYYSSFTSDTTFEKGYLHYLNQDCANAGAAPVPRANLPLKLIREINIHSSEIFSDPAKTKIGGVSGLSYDKEKRLLYMLSDENMQMSGLPSRIYAFNLNPDFSLTENHIVTLKSAESKSLKMDPEGLSRLSNGNFVVSSELEKTDAKSNIADNINIFTADGKWLESLSLPESFENKFEDSKKKNSKGVPYQVLQHGLEFNKSLESITVTPSNQSIFTGNEAPLVQDNRTKTECSFSNRSKKSKNSDSMTFVDYKPASNYDWNSPAPGGAAPGTGTVTPPATTYYAPKDCGGSVRIARYRINDHKSKKSDASYVYDSEYRYNLEREIDNGLSDLFAVDETHILALERSFDPVKQKVKARIFMITLDKNLALPNDVELKDDNALPALQKQLVMDLDDVLPSLAPGFRNLDNFEGMTLGPQLANGNATLILATDNNFSRKQRTTVLIFEIQK